MSAGPPTAPIRVHAWGPAASFTRYDTPAETDTYPILTVPAADGILSSIYWHPGFAYEIQRIDVLNPVEMYAQHGTEINTHPGEGGVNVQRVRTPRMRRLIHRPAYVIHARIVLRPEDDAPGTHGKFYGIFERRLQRGQCHESPYFGLREFACDVEPATGQEVPWAADADLGPLPLYLEPIEDRRGPLRLTRHHLDHASGQWLKQTYPGRVEAHFMDGMVRGGVLRVPPYRGRW